MSFPKRPLSLTGRALKDMAGIVAYTDRTWGETQADIYEDELNSVFELIQTSPEMSRERPELFAGCRSRPAEQHVIYFRIREDVISVHRVLHHKQDPTGKVRNPQR